MYLCFPYNTLQMQNSKGFWEKLDSNLESVKYAEPHLHYHNNVLRREWRNLSEEVNMCALKQSPELLLKSGCFKPKDRKVFCFFTTEIKIWESDYEECKDLHSFTYKVVACSSHFVKLMQESKQKQNSDIPVLLGGSVMCLWASVFGR